MKIALGRWLYLVLRPLLAITVSRQPRVRVEIRNRTRHVLLVKSWLSDQRWTLPGGGIKRGEAPSRAAVREVREETGLIIDRTRLAYLTTLPATYPLRCDLVVYSVTASRKTLAPLSRLQQLEIIDRKWYDIDNLPDDIAPLSRAVITREYKNIAPDE